MIQAIYFAFQPLFTYKMDAGSPDCFDFTSKEQILSIWPHTFFEEDGRQNTKDIKILLEYMVLIEILK
jgi:hypothetical protein